MRDRTGGASDEELMTAIRERHDGASFQVLHRRWRGRVHAFLRRRLRGPDRVEDTAQEVWLALWRYRHTYAPGRDFSPWLFTIAANASKVGPRLELLTADLEPAVEARDLVELRDWLSPALLALCHLDRRLLLLHVEGFPAKEIAALTDLTPGAVRTRLSRTRSALRAELSS